MLEEVHRVLRQPQILDQARPQDPPGALERVQRVVAEAPRVAALAAAPVVGEAELEAPADKASAPLSRLNENACTRTAAAIICHLLVKSVLWSSRQFGVCGNL